MYQRIIAKFNNISFSIIIGVCALLPLFFLPSSVAGFGAVKGVLLYIGVFLAFSFWLVAQFVEGSFKIPKHSALLAIGAWVVLALVSALASQNATVSLWGRGFAVDSFATVLIFGLFAFLIASYAREQRRLVTLFLAAFSGSVGTILLQIIFYLTKNTPFVSKYFSHVATSGTLVGSWVDFTYFVTFTFLLALLMYEVLSPRGLFRSVSFIAMIISMVALIFLNFKIAWIIAIVSALLVFVYKSSVERSLVTRFFTGTQPEGESAQDAPEQRFPLMSFIALLVGLFFFLSANSIGASLARYAGITFADIRPSFVATSEVMRATLAHDPLLGAGAGRFSDVWNLYHSADINQTQFWNTSFDAGFSYIQSLVTTNGILPTLALIAILVFSLIHGFRLFNYQFPDRFSRFIAVTGFIMLIGFVSLFFLTAPGVVLITFGFMYIGLLLGVSTMVGRTQIISLNYLRNPRSSFFSILILVIAAMAGFTAVYFSGNRFASIVYYNRAIAASNFDAAQARLNRAITLSQNDIYWRTRTALYTSQFTNLASQENPDKGQLQSTFSQAEQSARAAVAWDPESAGNWLTLSQVYQLVSNGSTPDAYNNGKVAADEAQKRNPNNPVYFLNQAQLALTRQDTQVALDSIAKALELKPNYLDAYVLRAQIRQAQGNTQAPKEEISNYIKTSPFDDQGYILLGESELALKNYQGALDAFAQAKELNPGNPNNYLSYISTLEVMGRKTDAVAALQDFKTRFPQVQGVDEQINRLKSGSGATTTPEATE